MNDSFHTGMVKLDIVRYKVPTCNLGDSVQEEEKGVTKISSFRGFHVKLSVIK